jgi:hypothetical protein
MALKSKAVGIGALALLACFLVPRAEARTLTAAEVTQACQGTVPDPAHAECVERFTALSLRSYDLAVDIDGVLQRMTLDDLAPLKFVSAHGVTIAVSAMPSSNEALISLRLKMDDEADTVVKPQGHNAVSAVFLRPADTVVKPQWYNTVSPVLLRPNETIVLATASGKRVLIHVRLGQADLTP